ncbi:hypothetical protein, partial [Enterobacter hormaechei]|uniref:hypothetical protein n=1 Tax=Enterobacter hormaechei TaxID=158836 RepID=UPI001954AC03
THVSGSYRSATGLFAGWHYVYPAYIVPTACTAARYFLDLARRVAQKNHLYLRNTEQAIQRLSSKLVSDIT